MSNYFVNDDLARQVWESKYRFKDESLDDFFKRLAVEFNRLDDFNTTDKKKLDALSAYGRARMQKKRDFLEYLQDFRYIIPGGSVLATLGTDKVSSLSNCFVTHTEDSTNAIFDTAKRMSQVYRRRGGIGTDVSVLRPRGASVSNAAGTTEGVVPFMELFSQTTTTISQSGRRGALMISIDINHPDSPDFVTSKQNLTKITGANISVKLNGDFIKAAENDEDYILRWPIDLPISKEKGVYDSVPYNELKAITCVDNCKGSDRTEVSGYIKKIKAKELWDSIITSAWKSAEPGILMWSNIINYDPASVYPEYKAISTNPCGEIPLSSADACRLIASNLYNLVKNKYTSESEIDGELAYKVFYEAQIMTDILVDLEMEYVQRIIDITDGDEKELWKHIQEVGRRGRRTGTGITGYGDMCAALLEPYGDLHTLEYIMKLKQEAELDATIDLAIIKGAFPAYNKEAEYSDDCVFGNDWFEFIFQTFPEQWVRMQNYGRRNISFSTIAPTGTINILVVIL